MHASISPTNKEVKFYDNAVDLEIKAIKISIVNPSAI